jgi:prepilin-type N-terminal cleavage/methylation domain-containing protein
MICRSASTPPPRRRCPMAGFTLVETMVVVAIISVLAMCAVPVFSRIKLRAKTTVVMSDFRTFGSAFDTCAQERGTFPPETVAGVLPPWMDGRIKTEAWARVTPIGGKYNWEVNQLHFGTRYRAAITISAVTGAPVALDADQLLDLDRMMDDGNLAGGSLRLGTGNVPLYVVAQ